VLIHGIGKTGKRCAGSATRKNYRKIKSLLQNTLKEKVNEKRFVQNFLYWTRRNGNDSDNNDNNLKRNGKNKRRF